MIYGFLFVIWGLVSFGQTIDLNQLTGKWHSYKISQEGKKDSVDDVFMTFKADSSYIEENKSDKVLVKGTYCLDRKNNQISFKDLFLMRKHPVGPIVKVYSETIISLDENNLMILVKPNVHIGDTQKDIKVYCKRVK